MTLKSHLFCIDYKVRNKNYCGDYRPIFLLQVTSKVFPKTVFKQLHVYLEKHKILTSQQVDFGKKQSIQISLQRMTNNWHLNKDKKSRFLISTGILKVLTVIYWLVKILKHFFSRNNGID